MKSIILQGSSRSRGNTNQVAKIFAKNLPAEIIDLKLKNINSYSYEHENSGDDFLQTMKQIAEYDTLIFMTPVYWYAMSGLMKNFFDRITDCLKIEKETGRKLKGKNMIAVSCGSDESETIGFFVPFKNSAEYLGMHYLGHIHTWVENGRLEQKVIDKVVVFINQIKKADLQ